MPSSDSPEVMVARFLQSHRYDETLHAFLNEAGLPPDAGVTGDRDCLTIEKVLEEKRQYEVGMAYEKVGGGGGAGEGGGEGQEGGWSIPAPSQGHQINSLTSNSNVLAVHVPALRDAWSTPDNRRSQQLFMSTADRRISILSVDADHDVDRIVDFSSAHNSPVLCITSITAEVFIATSMSGHVELFGADSASTTTRSPDYLGLHKSHAVQAIVTTSRITARDETPFCIAASAGWDRNIYLYSFEPPQATSISHTNRQGIIPPTREYEACLPLPTNPESILFIRHPDTDELHLIVGRRDSTYLYFYKIVEGNSAGRSSGTELTILEAGRQNLAPYANSWISFSLSSLAACPTDPTLVAVATSHLPHMKLIIVRLLFPGASERDAVASAAEATQSSQARAELVVQDREDAAIMTHVSTMAPQTPYSTPQVVWRPDGSGLWVNGDDGVIRGIEARTGKVVATLKGHEAGSKVRTLWAGIVADAGTVPIAGGEDAEAEWLVSGGFDKKVIVWKASRGEV